MKMNKPYAMSNIEVIKDFEEELFYGVIKDEFDQEDERTILSIGKTQFEALQKASNEIIKRLEICINKLNQICKSISSQYDISGEFYPNNFEVPKEHDFGEQGGKRDSFSALRFNKKLQKWTHSYR